MDVHPVRASSSRPVALPESVMSGFVPPGGNHAQRALRSLRSDNGSCLVPFRRHGRQTGTSGKGKLQRFAKALGQKKDLAFGKLLAQCRSLRFLAPKCAVEQTGLRKAVAYRLRSVFFPTQASQPQEKRTKYT